jgi:hypothetical protein
MRPAIVERNGSSIILFIENGSSVLKNGTSVPNVYSMKMYYVLKKDQMLCPCVQIEKGLDKA